MTSREIKILATLAKYQKQVTGWKFEPTSMPYTWYHVDGAGKIPPHIAIAYPKEADLSNCEELNNLLNYQWDEQLEPPEYTQYYINIYYISIQD